MDIPTNLDLNHIVCAGDGNVYIASRDGVVIKGRATTKESPEHWEIIKSDIKDLNGVLFEGAAWFKGKLYLSTSYGLYEMGEDKKIKTVEFSKEAQFSFQKVVANDEILVSYGPYNALVYDGKEWKTLISSLAQE